MNIYEKLIEVRKSVPFLKKESTGYQFSYTSSSQVLASLKTAMDEQSLLLISKVIGKEVNDHTTKDGKHNYFTELIIEYTWVNADDPNETIICPWYGQGLDNGEKGVGKALTYAEKYFMLKFFNIPTDKDDPDANQGSKGKPQTTKPQAKKKALNEYVDEMKKTTTEQTCRAWGAKSDAKKVLSKPDYAKLLTAWKEYGEILKSISFDCPIPDAVPSNVAHCEKIDCEEMGQCQPYIEAKGVNEG